MIKRGEVGLIMLDADWVTCVRIASRKTFDEYRAEVLSSSGRDPRLLGDERDSTGKRFITFDDALLRSKEAALTGYPHQGPRAGRAFMASLRSAGQTFNSHHTDFVRKSGVAEKSSAAREHRHGHEVLRLITEYDQIDICNSAAAEYVARRMLQIESAVRCNARQPDFEGLDALLDSAVDEGGAAIVAYFSTWVAERQKAEATTLKAGRQWREEKGAADKRAAAADKPTPAK